MTKQARSEHTRRLLLEAAAELLHQDGYAATSMVGIAQAAGVTKGGLYFHFSSKDEICDEVQVAATAVLAEHVHRQRVLPRQALPRLADLSHALMHWLDTDPTVGASFRMAREMGSADERFVAFSRAWLAQVHRYVADALEAGELGTDIPIETAELLVAVTCVGLESAVSSRIVKPEGDLAATLSKLWRLIELSPQAPSRRA
ncbi:ScbR family autoregulator-binding transcription factor [Amycolatopsis tolypomycina]|uniref:DNA-binding transcriptional regulator, AcrR family n=1 Tax=Amycolatopsis tolypomycina TaxID=208445 RepID=A0A1H4XKK6_9PSEU|nr:ScbR family autoregulator-binding transcription factor [Amycolatopsis tolypomycina]SED06156.1 DNA-binding transcriptional regulator, AcrR family [Amycolatopsis tolypomycina]